MIIVGLTGSIGMGKSTTADMFRDAGIPVFDADAAVHALQAKDGRAIPAIAEAFPSVVTEGELDRQKLGAIVFADVTAKQKLEAIIHPMVGEERAAFFAEAEAAAAPFVVLDIPLLFETGGNKACDKIVVASAPADVQRERVLARPGMSAEKFDQILLRQTPDADKRAGADYIVDTSQGFDPAREQVAAIIADLKEQAGA